MLWYAWQQGNVKNRAQGSPGGKTQQNKTRRKSKEVPNPSATMELFSFVQPRLYLVNVMQLPGKFFELDAALELMDKVLPL